MSLKGQDKEENLIEELNIDVSQPPCYLDSLFFIHLSIIKCNTMNGMPKDQRKEQESHLQVTFTHLSRDWSPKFETGLNIIIGIVQKG